jgi:tetratricopeptide (TPR) repeat protein
MWMIRWIVRVSLFIFVALAVVPLASAQFVAPPDATPSCVYGCGSGSGGSTSGGGGRGLIGIIENLAERWEREKRQWEERRYARGLELNNEALAILKEVSALDLLAKGKHEEALKKLKVALEKHQEAEQLIPSSSTLRQNVRLTTALVAYSEGILAIQNNNPELALTKFQETKAQISDDYGRALFINDWLARAQAEIIREKERLMDEARLTPAKDKINSILDNLSNEFASGNWPQGGSTGPAARSTSTPTPDDASTVDLRFLETQGGCAAGASGGFVDSSTVDLRCAGTLTVDPARVRGPAQTGGLDFMTARAPAQPPVTAVQKPEPEDLYFLFGFRRWPGPRRSPDDPPLRNPLRDAAEAKPQPRNLLELLQQAEEPNSPVDPVFLPPGVADQYRSDDQFRAQVNETAARFQARYRGALERAQAESVEEMRQEVQRLQEQGILRKGVPISQQDSTASQAMDEARRRVLRSYESKRSAALQMHGGGLREWFEAAPGMTSP